MQMIEVFDDIYQSLHQRLTEMIKRFVWNVDDEEKEEKMDIETGQDTTDEALTVAERMDRV